MTYALQNACLNGCAYLTIPVTMYLSLYFRLSNVPIHDSQTLHSKMRAVPRIIIYCLVSVISSLPAIFIKVTYMGSPIVIMFTNVVIPGAIVSIYLIAGGYDKFVQII